MLILLLLLMISSITLFVSKARTSSTYWKAGVLIGWFISMVGFIVFIAKFGGFYFYVNQFLYINDSIRLLLANSPVSIATISRMLTFGRSIFVFCLIGLALDLYSKHVPSRKKLVLVVSALFSIFNIVFYDPLVYSELIYVISQSTLFAMSVVIRVWIIISLAFSICLLIIAYRKTSIPWNKYRLIFILLGVTSLSLFYLYIIFMGPLQFTDARTYYFLYHDFSNFNPPITLTEWYAGVVLTGVTMIISVISLWKYQKVEAQWGNKDITVVRRYNTANMGVRVFSHAIKNQLLMLQLLLKSMESELDNRNANDTRDKLNKHLQDAMSITNHTVVRVDELYKSFQTSQMYFKPIKLQDVMERCKGKIAVVPSNITLEFHLSSVETLILADERHLPEVLYNIIINAFEAIHHKEQGTVVVSSFTEDKWMVIEIWDNGPGIPDDMVDQIFEPFFTKKNTSKNWGVGLSYARQIVNYHFGHIQAIKGQSVGSLFQIFLPTYTINERRRANKHV